MNKKIRSLEIRIARLENKVAGSWIEEKIEEFEKSLNLTRQQNRKELKNMKEVLEKSDLTSLGSIGREIDKVGKNPSDLEKEVLSNVKKLPTFKTRVKYLSDLWESRFERSSKKAKQSLIQGEDYFWVALSHGLFYACKLSMGSLFVINAGLFLTKLMLIGMVAYLVLVDFGIYKKIKSMFFSKSEGIKQASFRSPEPILVDLY